ncbi:hypothetical protein CMQ_4531 [Grosmannia clavigera kw1407]|uniref:Protein ECM13 n=1 Tax=Grosmannia clavigera (strain kw1407 / UAMH 11150) TaxID=655863 RepID=F0XUB7_GROCL|nr:uncharacterized protein CMQ_4531 [Grosmannia clavigera kw1407]EFW98679.1 hypothetical protein CMQ_4531 [Grosmannia clavigera kw1407]
MSTTSASTVSAFPQSTKTSPAPPSLASPVRRKTMSITQTYFLAHKARAKLSSQAARPDHNLRLLVGHANLLDTLMLELADAEREQESWFNQSVRVASPAQSPAAASHKSDRHVQWADAIVEEESEEDWEADDSDVSSDTSSDYTEDEDEDEDDEDSESSENDIYDEDCDMADAPLRRVSSHNSNYPSTSTSSSSSPTAIAIEVTEAEDDSDAEVDDDEEDYTELTLTRSPSHSVSASLPSPTSPPELVMEDSDMSEDEAMPPSPPIIALESFSKSAVASKQSATKFDDSDRLYLSPRNPERVISSVSVY